MLQIPSQILLHFIFQYKHKLQLSQIPIHSDNKKSSLDYAPGSNDIYVSLSHLLIDTTGVMTIAIKCVFSFIYILK